MTRLRAAALVVVGLALLASPLVLPVETGGGEVTYVHTVQPTDAGTPEYDAADVRAYGDLSPAAREAFDAARERRSVTVGADERLAGYDYVASEEATLGEGLVVVEHEGTEYEFWTRREVRDGRLVTAQLFARPVLFLLGLFCLAAGPALYYGRRD